MRGRFGAAAVAAAAVAVGFATVGDGVDAPGTSGPRQLVVDVGHTATWVVLALAFTVAAFLGRWQRASRVLAALGGVLYAVFLLAVFAPVGAG